MDEAFELRCQHHVNNDQCEDQHPVNFLAGILKIPGFSGPVIQKAIGHLLVQHAFDAIHRRSHGHPDRRTGDGGTSQSVVPFDLVRRNAHIAADDAGQLNETPALVAHIDLVQIVRRQSADPLKLGDHIIFFAVFFHAADIQSTEEDLQRA